MIAPSRDDEGPSPRCCDAPLEVGPSSELKTAIQNNRHEGSWLGTPVLALGRIGPLGSLAPPNRRFGGYLLDSLLKRSYSAALAPSSMNSFALERISGRRRTIDLITNQSTTTYATTPYGKYLTGEGGTG